MWKKKILKYLMKNSRIICELNNVSKTFSFCALSDYFLYFRQSRFQLNNSILSIFQNFFFANHSKKSFAEYNWKLKYFMNFQNLFFQLGLIGNRQYVNTVIYWSQEFIQEYMYSTCIHPLHTFRFSLIYRQLRRHINTSYQRIPILIITSCLVTGRQELYKPWCHSPFEQEICRSCFKLQTRSQTSTQRCNNDNESS